MSDAANGNGGGGDSDPVERGISALVWGVPLGLLVFFAPGLAIDWLFGRFKDAPNGLFGSAIQDGLTWFLSLLFWVGLVGLILWLFGGSGTPAAVLAPDEAEPGFSPEQEAPPLTAESSTWEDVARILEQERANENEGDDGFGALCTDEACAEQLGVSGELTMEDIHRAYRQRMREYHPDRVAHLGPKLRELAELESKRLNVAYQYFVDRYGQAV